MMTQRFTRLLGALWLGLAGAAAGEPYPAYDDLFVNDHAAIIDAGTEAAMRAELQTLKDETGIEMTVLTIPTRSDYDPSASIEAFATGLFNAWGVGDAERNDGILLLVVPEDRETRIELGDAYNQGYDVLAQDIASRWLVPEFRDGRYAEGIDAGTREIIGRIARRHAGNLPPEMLAPEPRTLADRVGSWLPFIGFAAVAGAMIFRNRVGDGLTRLRRCPNCGRRRLHRHRDILREASRTEPGSGRMITDCGNCDYRDERDYRIGKSGGLKSGGSFGGGRSSGGGATGRW